MNRGYNTESRALSLSLSLCVCVYVCVCLYRGSNISILTQYRSKVRKMSGGSRGSAGCLRCCLVIFAMASALCVSAPALYWRFRKGYGGSSAASSSCHPCICDCPPPLSLQKIAPGLLNLSVTDCGKNDPELNKEMEKQFVDLLTEELKLREVVTEEHAHHMNATLVDAKRLAMQYQKEAEKCNAATETCEEARERAEAALMKEKKLTAYWERQALALGWQDA